RPGAQGNSASRRYIDNGSIDGRPEVRSDVVAFAVTQRANSAAPTMNAFRHMGTSALSFACDCNRCGNGNRCGWELMDRKNISERGQGLYHSPPSPGRLWCTDLGSLPPAGVA